MPQRKTPDQINDEIRNKLTVLVERLEKLPRPDVAKDDEEIKKLLKDICDMANENTDFLPADLRKQLSQIFFVVKTRDESETFFIDL